MPPTDASQRDELVPADDAVIGRAFRWSLAVIALIAAIGLGAWWWAQLGDAAPEEILQKDPGAIAGLARPEQPLPSIPFTDVTSSAGLDFVRSSGAAGEKLLPETMGGGGGFIDVDGDGDQDIVLINGRHWPWDPAPARAATCALYLNDGSGRYENASSAAGLDLSVHGMGLASGDYDGDGDVDLYLTAVGPNRLLRNDGGTFVDVTAGAGVAGGEQEWSTSAAFFDADGDGALDLFVCNYVAWSREVDLEVSYSLNGVDRAYGPPTNFRGAHCALYRNLGDGAFQDVSERAGLHVVNEVTGVPVGKSLALRPVDVDADGDLDVIVANDTTRNFLFVNDGRGAFEEVGAPSGIAYDGMGQSTGAMGIDAANYRNDDELAVGIGNFANEMTSFYVRRPGSPLFSDDAIVEGIGSPSRLVLSFGLFFFDADLDGRLDMLQVNGHLEETISQLQPSQKYAQRPQLFWNAGGASGATYVAAPPERVGALAEPLVGRGAAYADIDGDGDLDVLLMQVDGPPRLLRNDQQLGHRWLRVQLRGAPPNTDAIGARVELTAGGATRRADVMPARSYLSSVELPVTFGLGDAAVVDQLVVVWPDGTRTEVGVPSLDRVITVDQPLPATASSGRRGPG